MPVPNLEFIQNIDHVFVFAAFRGLDHKDRVPAASGFGADSGFGLLGAAIGTSAHMRLNRSANSAIRKIR
jgi:hypothetical protein